MSGEQPAPTNGGIGSVRIDPAAEEISRQPAAVSAQQEVDYFEQGRARFLLEQNQQNLGVLGKFFGASSAAPTNIAGLVAVCSILLIVISFLMPSTPELVDARKWFFALITSALGFIFGAASKK